MSLEGFAFTEHGWVQSYGSRYVRPPVIFGDVKRTAAMTVREFEVAQRLTEQPVKVRDHWMFTRGCGAQGVHDERCTTEDCTDQC